jgi:hypothetical protein
MSSAVFIRFYDMSVMYVSLSCLYLLVDLLFTAGLGRYNLNKDSETCIKGFCVRTPELSQSSNFQMLVFYAVFVVNIVLQRNRRAKQLPFIEIDISYDKPAPLHEAKFLDSILRMQSESRLPPVLPAALSAPPAAPRPQSASQVSAVEMYQPQPEVNNGAQSPPSRPLSSSDGTSVASRPHSEAPSSASATPFNRHITFSQPFLSSPPSDAGCCAWASYYVSLFFTLPHVVSTSFAVYPTLGTVMDLTFGCLLSYHIRHTSAKSVERIQAQEQAADLSINKRTLLDTEILAIASRSAEAHAVQKRAKAKAAARAEEAETAQGERQALEVRGGGEDDADDDDSDGVEGARGLEDFLSKEMAGGRTKFQLVKDLSHCVLTRAEFDPVNRIDFMRRIALSPFYFWAVGPLALASIVVVHAAQAHDAVMVVVALFVSVVAAFELTRYDRILLLHLLGNLEAFIVFLSLIRYLVFSIMSQV